MIHTLPQGDSEEVRMEICRIFKHPKPPKNNITKEERVALRELQEDQEIVVLKTDKGNTTIIMKPPTTKPRQKAC